MKRVLFQVDLLLVGSYQIFVVMGDLNNGKIIHGFSMKMGCDSGVVVSNSLIDMYGKCKCIEDALEIFEMMKGNDIFSRNSIVSVYEEW